MIKKYTVLISLLLTVSVYGQIVFEKTYGTIGHDIAYSIYQCSDNSYIICGTSQESDKGDKDVYIIKINEFGDTLWTKIETVDETSEKAYSVFEDNNQQYIIAGQAVVNNKNVPFLSKYNHDGQLFWKQTYESEIPEGKASMAILCDDSDYAFAGNVRYSKSGSFMLTRRNYLIKTNQNGEFLWKNDYGSNSYESSISDIIETTNNGFAICGSKEVDIVDTDAWIIKTNEEGGLSWDHTVGQTQYAEYAHSFKQTADGGYIMCGTSIYGYTGLQSQLFIAKTNNLGVEEWRKIYDFGEDADIAGIAIDFANDGGYFVCANISGIYGPPNDILLMRTNSIGDTLWTRIHGGINDDRVFDMHKTSDGGVIMCGLTTSFGEGGMDVFVIKTNSNGLITGTPSPHVINSIVKVYPNPSHNIINIQSELGNSNFRIYNINGVLIKSGEISLLKNISVSINLSNEKTGIYYLILNTKEKSVVKKLVKY